MNYFTSAEFGLILAIIPLLIGTLKGLYSISNKKTWLSNSDKTDIVTIQHTLENPILNSLEKTSLNESLIRAQFKQLYGSPFNREHRQKVILSEGISLGDMNYHDFRKAKSNIRLKGDDITFHKPFMFSYETWACIQKWTGHLLALYSFVFLCFYSYKFITEIAEEVINLNGIFSLNDYFIIFTTLVYIGLAIFMNELYLQTKATIKVKKHLNQLATNSST